eukprot:CAMPEP_0179055558 /NCGR_PEP_ID=MMETSP0796-20121207/23364_1 /TAXON_ID=73915 /ORGANISM="Pyrodinium bahamense, Strain pbaha01" /LENGTH=220 /DNA_ID=CAMNT_0020752217 /DNA_START=439 /DNA_END=1103 /DNA_ORIENTATION=+
MHGGRGGIVVPKGVQAAPVQDHRLTRDGNLGDVLEESIKVRLYELHDALQASAHPVKRHVGSTTADVLEGGLRSTVRAQGHYWTAWVASSQYWEAWGSVSKKSGQLPPPHKAVRHRLRTTSAALAQRPGVRRRQAACSSPEPPWQPLQQLRKQQEAALRLPRRPRAARGSALRGLCPWQCDGSGCRHTDADGTVRPSPTGKTQQAPPLAPPSGWRLVHVS